MENDQNINNLNDTNDQVNRAFLQQMHNRNLQRTELINVDKIFNILLSKTFFILSFSISLLSYYLIYLYFRNRVLTYKDLEKEEMNIYYIGVFMLVLTTIWNIFLLFYQIIFNFDYTKICLSDEVIIPIN